jgi:hypothetical protein
MTSKKKSRAFDAHFAKVRETKGAVRYTEIISATDATPVAIGGGAKIGTFYVRKSSFRGRYPKLLSVRVRPRTGQD